MSRFRSRSESGCLWVCTQPLAKDFADTTAADGVLIDLLGVLRAHHWFQSQLTSMGVHTVRTSRGLPEKALSSLSSSTAILASKAFLYGPPP